MAHEKAIFAGGCFWCMQPPFDLLTGVVSTTVGYTGGDVPNPSYQAVCSGMTRHTEAVEVEFDAEVVSYATLLEVFWQNINPTTVNGQFADRGTQYRTGIFYLNDEQKRLAEASKAQLNASGKFTDPIATEVTQASDFYSAEVDHQSYYQKNEAHYNRYKVGSGRAQYLEDTWQES